MKRRILLMSAASLLLMQPPHSAQAQFVVACANCSTYTDQLAANAKQALQYVSQLQQKATQLQQYANQIQNTIALPQMVWSQVQGDIGQVRNLVNAASVGLPKPLRQRSQLKATQSE